MNTLVYRNAFVLIHSAKRGLTTYGDEDADQSILVELESDLSVALMNQEITDREEIIQALSDMTLVNDSQNQLLNDISTHLDSSISDLMNRIENISVGDFSQLIGEIEDNEEAITRYLSIIDNSVYLQKMQLFDNSTLIGEVSTRLLYLKNLHVTPLENNVTDISTKLTDLSTYIDNFNPGSDYDDSELTNTLNDLSTYTHNIVIPSEYDDSVLKGRIADISTYAINTSSRLNDLSTFAHNITPGSDYDDSELTNKLNDLSTYTHNLVIPTEYDDSVLKNRIADVSSKLIDLSVYVDNYDFTYFDTQITNQQVRIEDVSLYAIDLSTRLNDVSVRLSQSGGGSGEVDLTEVNASINDLSTRLNDVSLRLLQSNITGSGRAEFDDLVFYRSLKQIPQSWLNTSMACFHDIIFNVSYFGASSAQDGRYKINLESGNWINLDKIAYYQVSESGYRYHYTYVTDANPWEARIYRVDENKHYFAFHFLHQEKIVSVNWAVNDVSNSIFFRIEDQI